MGKTREQGEEIKSIKNRCSQPEGRVAILENLANIQGRKADDMEQYGRRLCPRVDDIPLRSSETTKDIKHELHKEFEKNGIAATRGNH